MNVGEGAAFLLLERDRPSTVVLSGVGESNDAFHMSAPDAQGHGAAAAMRAALRDAGLKPEQVDYVNAHGTGTVRNDSAESQAIAQVLGTQVPVVSTKSYTGHMLGAGGATEAVFTIVALDQQWIPANLGLAAGPSEIAINLPRVRTPARLKHAVSNAFAFGGSNITLAFSETSP